MLQNECNLFLHWFMARASLALWVMVFRCEGLINSSGCRLHGSSPAEWYSFSITLPQTWSIDFNILEVLTQIQLSQNTSTGVGVAIIIQKSLKTLACKYAAYVFKNQAPHLTLFAQYIPLVACAFFTCCTLA